MKLGLVLGFFDGVHKAHRAVIESALNYADETVLITFKNSPALYFTGKCEYILSRENSINKIKNLGVNKVIELEFSKIATMKAKDYLYYLIKEYKPACIATGFNHTFGLNKAGNPDFLLSNSKKYNYEYICSPPIEEDGLVVSSTLIRNLLQKGEIEKANLLLESNFTLEGAVKHGAKIGRTIGFPTANINYPEKLVKLPFGVYCANVFLDNMYKPAVLNWGIKPTVNNTFEPIAEAHILGFNGDLYGKHIKIEVMKKIRGEVRFNSLDELKNQIKKDVESC